MNSNKNPLIKKFISNINEKFEEYKQSINEGEENTELMDEIWELSKEKFILETENQEKYKTYEGMIFTVGFTSEPIVLNILATNPKALFFIFTEESEKTVHKVVEELDLKSERFDQKIIKKDSFDNSVSLIGLGLQYLNRKNKIDITKIGLDITGGTKVMSVACGLASYAFGPDGPDLFYISHEKYDTELRRPVPGTEKLTIIENPLKRGTEALSEMGFDNEIEIRYEK
jgi:hypothetical protein